MRDSSGRLLQSRGRVLILLNVQSCSQVLMNSKGGQLLRVRNGGGLLLLGRNGCRPLLLGRNGGWTLLLGRNGCHPLALSGRLLLFFLVAVFNHDESVQRTGSTPDGCSRSHAEKLLSSDGRLLRDSTLGCGRRRGLAPWLKDLRVPDLQPQVHLARSQLTLLAVLVLEDRVGVSDRLADCARALEVLRELRALRGENSLSARQTKRAERDANLTVFSRIANAFCSAVRPGVWFALTNSSPLTALTIVTLARPLPSLYRKPAKIVCQIEQKNGEQGQISS